MKKLVPLLLLVFVLLVNGCGKGKTPKVKPPVTPSRIPKGDSLPNHSGPTRITRLPTPQEIAMEAIKKLGGKVTLDKGGMVKKVDLPYKKVADSDLVHLKVLTSLQSLNLNGNQVSDAGLLHLNSLTSLQGLFLGSNMITDAGLVHLKVLTNLQSLNLNNTQVSDAGLVNLKKLPNLKHLGLISTQVTDAGFIHLKSFISLESLSLGGTTKVTDSGVKELQAALPNCSIDTQLF